MNKPNKFPLRLTAKSKLKVGDWVLVHRHIIEGFRVFYGPCTLHDHWESRVVDWNEDNGCWNVAAKIGDGDALWAVQPERRLTRLDKGNDWTERSLFRPGMKVIAPNPEWPRPEHRQSVDDGREFCVATIKVAHLEIGDWYVSFDETCFDKVVHESSMVPFVAGQSREFWAGRFRAQKLAEEGAVVLFSSEWRHCAYNESKKEISILCACGRTYDVEMRRVTVNVAGASTRYAYSPTMEACCPSCEVRLALTKSDTRMHGFEVKVLG